MSLLDESVEEVALTPDAASERAHLPSPEGLRGDLLLADRGYSGSMRPYCLARVVRAYREPETHTEMSGMTEVDAQEFAEGLNGRMGFQLVEWREGFARVTVALDERHKNRQGGLHGGVTAALIDAATGFCGIYEPDCEKRRGNVTVSLNVSYTGRPKGTRLTCSAEVLRAGRRLYFSSAQVHDDVGNLIASGEAVYAYVDRGAQRRTSG